MSKTTDFNKVPIARLQGWLAFWQNDIIKCEDQLSWLNSLVGTNMDTEDLRVDITYTEGQLELAREMARKIATIIVIRTKNKVGYRD